MQLTAHGVTLEASLDWPQQPRGIVVFAHGLAEGLHDVGLASLLLNLLTPEEETADQIGRPWLSQGICRCPPGPHRLEVVPGASHLFEEPGAMRRVTTLASDWFCQDLGPPRPLCPA